MWRWRARSTGSARATRRCATLQRGLDWFAQAAVSNRARPCSGRTSSRLQLWRGDHSAVIDWAAGRQLSSTWTPVIDPGIDECLTLVRLSIAQRDQAPLAKRYTCSINLRKLLRQHRCWEC